MEIPFHRLRGHPAEPRQHGFNGFDPTGAAPNNNRVFPPTEVQRRRIQLRGVDDRPLEHDRVLWRRGRPGVLRRFGAGGLESGPMSEGIPSSLIHFGGPHVPTIMMAASKMPSLPSLTTQRATLICALDSRASDRGHAGLRKSLVAKPSLTGKPPTSKRVLDSR
ncbi:hypothetical protein BD779DRAFT_1802612 [Infundibulicybe gibba]|nr:hypothetical protein BD779DRAFT_1802612 [Infundibulicybe gibba]